MELTFLNNEINFKKKSSETENEIIFFTSIDKQVSTYIDIPR